MGNKILKVVKIGGKLIENPVFLNSFLEDFVEMRGPKILVHGGGNKATAVAGKLGFETKMIDGRRITDKDSMEVITMVYGGLINKSIVAKLQSKKQNAIGLCGADGNVLISKRREVKEIDYGFVGDIEKVNSGFIESILNQNMIPVFSAISCTEDGVLLNTNGDSVASEIAIAMSKSFETQLYYCSEKKGVLTDMENDRSVISELNSTYYKELVETKVIKDGMLPKLHNCFEAINKGVATVFLGDSELLKKNAIHTKIVK
ncbi:acetylglutamate kinase [Christiangramia forsetii]|uniref:Acetylglutamate kinase n=2 Tax=Christiangramia forsetii TaxID=411153 RepID=A0M371_CHRFK|nr:acetylglutamate kinase [Christiangramia forsetii]GGG26598.1 acetylglutamate kinase [Christiangramia forsetii]CAL67066.1 acetylglutamate kinase [Christiangramia forsetii KT0803]